MPWQDMRAMILDEQGEWLRDAEVDEVGAICISGPNVFPGYLSAVHNQGVWFDTAQTNSQCGKTSQRWFNTGDLGRQDADGYFWLAGRKKELIIRGGHNIDPKSIEEVLAGHPAVAMCAAVGRPDANAGEVPVVYVQLRAGAAAGEQTLLDYAAKHITERAAVPKAVCIIEALPLTAVGKIFKPALALREVELVVRQEAAANAVELVELRVAQDPKRGIVARYRLAGDADKLAAVLGRYVFCSEVL
jgi:fatty-acyl-CoA synthase/long-chain acyl-CoA synthetase